MKLTEKEKTEKEYLGSKFKILIVKRKGKKNTVQKYKGTKQEIAVGVASMLEQLLCNDVFTASQLKYMLELAIQAYEGKLED